jgi:NADPH-dependent F420 reductase
MTRSIGLIGGTGPEGKGLAARFASAGLDAVIGSRSKERGAEAAREVASHLGRDVRGGTNEDAAGADLIVVTVPYEALADTLPPLETAIGEKVVVSTVTALEFSRQRVATRPVVEGSAAEAIQRLLPRARVVGAFHSLPARHLSDVSHSLEGDVIICGDDTEAVEQVIELAGLIKDVRGIKGGPLANCAYVEALTALLINVNRLYKAETNVRIVGLDT